MKKSKLKIIIQTLEENLISIWEYNKSGNKITVFVLNAIDYSKLALIKTEFKKENFIIFSEDDIINGSDVFPIKFLHIQNNFKLIEWENVFKEIKINKKHLRLDLENDLRNKLIYLREEFILIKQTTDLLKNVLPAFDLILTSILFIKNIKPTNDFIKDIELIEKEFNISLVVFRDLYNLDNKKIMAEVGVSFVQKIHDEINSLLNKIDNLIIN